jgi:hypothetical protein
MSEPHYRNSKRARGRHGEPQVITALSPDGMSPLRAPGTSSQLMGGAEIDEDDYLNGAAQVAPQALEEICVSELLDLDSRPTFVVDLQARDKEVEGRMNIVYCNKALRFFVCSQSHRKYLTLTRPEDDLRKVIYADTFYPPTVSAPTKSQQASATADAKFKQWATSVPNFDSATDGYRPRHTFRGV